MNETELLLVGFVLVASSGLSWILGLIAGSAVQRRLSQPRDDDEDLSVRVARLEPVEVPTEVRGEGTDEEVAALETVRESDEAERTASTRGFRGEDLSDREVTRWLERFGL